MADSPMSTVLFISVFVFLFFKFCLGVPQLPPVDVLAPLAAQAAHRGDGLGHLDHQSHNMAMDAVPVPLPLVRKCPVGTVYSVAVGGCKDLVRSPKDPSQKLQLLMPYLLAATQHQPGQWQ